MDESGGSGQPRSGTDRPAEPHAGPRAQTTDPTSPDPHDNGSRPAEPQPADPRPTPADNAAQDTTDPAGAEAPGPATVPADADHSPTAGASNPDGAQRPPAADEAVPDAPASQGAEAPGPADAAQRPPAADEAVQDAPASQGAEAPGPADAAQRPPAADNAVPDAPASHAAGTTGDDTVAQDAPASHRTGTPEPGDAQAARGETDSQDRAHPTAPGVPHADGPADGAAPGADLRKPEAAHDPHGTEDHRTLAHSGTPRNPSPPQSPQPRGGLLMGRPFGVPVYVAPSWFLVAALITWVFGGQLERVLPELGAARYLVSLFFAVAFYASVLVHELAHTVAALRFKLPVRRIQLQFFGGVSEIEKEAETPGREFVLAFVGPLLSLVLAGLFYLAMQPVEPGTVPGVLLAGLMVSNLIVAAFNLLPGLPLDGGRMLRAVVWKITGKPMSGTIAAAWVGRALAVCVLIGLPLLTQSGALGSSAEDNVGMDTVMDALLAAILAAIIWTGAGNSLRMARLREHLPELRARTLTRRAVPVETDTPLSEALRRANDAGARALVVVDAEGAPLSLVREAAIVGVPEHRRPWVAVSGLAQDLTDGMRVSAELAGEDLLDALRATPATEYLVVEETGEIYGVLSAADVERAFVKAMARPS
ncbi:site-2 protease family protein [Streptomyces sp. A2-16]|uniref:site-2 protease family protein n=1 Tax=Streptomyces sp. A2-16 TaxID=2781734 RepID=UPI001BAFE2DC|nr:site-2 protease family protein [Streptomyces sp. A2-16]QUC60817.1 site-2 protease family protein [Streptomyces sp. A2-16]